MLTRTIVWFYQTIKKAQGKIPWAFFLCVYNLIEIGLALGGYLVGDLQSFHWTHMYIHHSGANVSVAQHHLELYQVTSGGIEVACEGVPEGMGVDIFFNASIPTDPLDHSPQPPVTNLNSPLHGVKEPGSRHLFGRGVVPSHPQPQEFHVSRTNPYRPIFATLTLPYPGVPGIPVDIMPLEV